MGCIGCKRFDLWSSHCECSKVFGRVDVLLIIAGYLILGAVQDISFISNFKAMKDLADTSMVRRKPKLSSPYFFGPLLFDPTALPPKSRTIVNITSVDRFDGLPPLGLYGASKFALEGSYSSPFPPIPLQNRDKATRATQKKGPSNPKDFQNPLPVKFQFSASTSYATSTAPSELGFSYAPPGCIPRKTRHQPTLVLPCNRLSRSLMK